MKKSSKAPIHLSAEACRWWRQLTTEFPIDDADGRLLLQTGLEAFDRMRECQRSIAKDGTVVEDRFGQKKPHPLLSAERDSRAQMLQALRQLGLELGEPSTALDGSRPSATVRSLP